MKILVFGHSGQVATELRAEGARLGHVIMALDRATADLSNPTACAAHITATDADAVINAAAWTAVDAAEEHEPAATVINGEAPGAMAAAAAARGLPFVHISTDYVFDGSGTQPWAVDAPTGPLGAYGRSKLAGERAVMAAIGAGQGRAAILRTAWVFSAHGANFVKTMLRLSDTRDALNVVGDQIGGPTPARDIARACLHLAETLGDRPPGSHMLHFSGAPDVSWADFAREIFAQTRRDVTVTDITTDQYPTPARRPANSRLDGTGLADVGLTRPDWRAGLADVLTEVQSSTEKAVT